MVNGGSRVESAVMNRRKHFQFKGMAFVTHHFRVFKYVQLVELSLLNHK